jgi:ABC-2 type transport system ATP-binding protein
MLTTLLPPTGGTALVAGHDVVTEPDAVRRSIGVIPQALTSDLELSVEENLLIFAKLYSVPRGKRERLIDELLEAVELTQWRAAPVKNLSGGMRRRVEIAAAWCTSRASSSSTSRRPASTPSRAWPVWEMLRRIKSQRQLTGAAHHPLHGRGRQALRPHRDRGPRRAQGARLPAQAQGRGPRPQRRRGELRERARDWSERLRALPSVESVGAHDNVFRIGTANGPATTLALMEAAARAEVKVESLSVQSTTLDDVFVHYAGRDLRDELQAASVQDSPFMLRRG